jgi:molybdopterin converting factor small subunit
VAVVLLPGLLAAQAGGESRFEVHGDTLGEALRELPVADLLLDEHGAVRPLVNVYVDRERVTDLGAALAPDASVRVVAAIAGG